MGRYLGEINSYGSSQMNYLFFEIFLTSPTYEVTKHLQETLKKHLQEIDQMQYKTTQCQDQMQYKTTQCQSATLIGHMIQSIYEIIYIYNSLEFRNSSEHFIKTRIESNSNFNNITNWRAKLLFREFQQVVQLSR